ncbi:MAG TPA: glycoside hydrolase domain-containing protein [Streptosporangiaceae bacterium]|nr:glycoside hydrolase domain-containing protein [Streptosporangiaceae bacterium]
MSYLTAAHPVYEYASPAAGPSTPTHTGLAIKKGYMYVNGGFWDTYRTEWSLGSLLYPTLTGHMIDGFLNMYHDGGWLPRWSAPGYDGATPGTSADVAIADAYLNGVTDFPVTQAYQAIKKDAMVVSGNGAVGRQAWPARSSSDTPRLMLAAAASTGRWRTTSTTSGSPPWPRPWPSSPAIPLPSGASTGPTRPSSSTSPRTTATSTTLSSASSRARRPPAPGGSQYDPRVWGNEYQEADGWTYAFYTPQDGQGLAILYGGRAALAAKLDQYFSTHETAQHDPSQGTATITYTDGSTQKVNLAFSDWTLAGGLLSGDSVVAKMPYRNTPSGKSQVSSTYLFAATVDLESGKTVASVTLPAQASQGELHVFAIATQQATGS